VVVGGIFGQTFRRGQIQDVRWQLPNGLREIISRSEAAEAGHG
jgi:hypothetical protein